MKKTKTHHIENFAHNLKLKTQNSKLNPPNSKLKTHHSSLITRYSSGVGNTAHFTAAAWAELGVPGAEIFVTRRGQILLKMVHWGGAFFGLFGRYDTVNLFLATRHLGINALLEQFQPQQVIELAAGLSSRGYQWSQKHEGVYVEIDQPAIIAAKQGILAVHPAQLKGQHQLIGIDLVQEDLSPLTHPSTSCSPRRGEGTEPLAQSIKLDQTARTLIIVEGLTGYLGQEAMHALLQKIYKLAASFENCTVLIDFYLKLQPRQHKRVALAMYPPQLIWRLMRAPMRMFLRNADDIKALVEAAGFKVQHLHAVPALAKIAGRTPPPVNLFYLAELRTN